MSGFLTPQLQLGDPISVLNNLPELSEIEAEYSQKYQKIDDEQILIIKQKLLECDIDETKIQNCDPYGYKWLQMGEQIQIHYDSKMPITGNDIHISEESISSPFICGRWYGKIVNTEVTIENMHVRIDIEIETCKEMKGWPVLICGGDMDATSYYILSRVAFKLQLNQISDHLTFYSALHGNKMAMLLASTLTMRKEPIKSLFWTARIIKQEPMADEIQKAGTLLLKSGIEGGASLAEILLCKAAPQTGETCFIALGRLHLSNTPDFDADPKLGVQYMQFCATNFRSAAAMRILAECFTKGIGTAVDLEAAERYRQQAAEIDPNYVETVEDLEEPEPESESDQYEEEEEEEEKIESKKVTKPPPPPPSSESGLDTIAAGLSAVAFVGGAFALRTLLKRFRK